MGGKKGKGKKSKKKLNKGKQEKSHKESERQDCTTEIARLRDDLQVRKLFVSSDPLHRNNYFEEMLKIEKRVNELDDSTISVPRDVQVNIFLLLFSV